MLFLRNWQFLGKYPFFKRKKDLYGLLHVLGKRVTFLNSYSDMRQHDWHPDYFMTSLIRVFFAITNSYLTFCIKKNTTELNYITVQKNHFFFFGSSIRNFLELFFFFYRSPVNNKYCFGSIYEKEKRDRSF